MPSYLAVRSAVGDAGDGEAIRAEAIRQVGDGMKTARNPGDHERLWKSIALRQDERIRDVSGRLGIQVACKMGCTLCCHGAVTTQAHEVLYLAGWIQHRLAAGVVAQISKSAKARHGMAVAGVDRRELRSPCPVLQDGKCAAYEARPLVCRGMHSMSLSPCQHWFDHPGAVSHDDHPHESLTSRTKPFRQGIYEGFESVGKDATIYELAPALHEALDDERCGKRWRDGKKVFTAACRIS